MNKLNFTKEWKVKGWSEEFDEIWPEKFEVMAATVTGDWMIARHGLKLFIENLLKEREVEIVGEILNMAFYQGVGQPGIIELERVKQYALSHKIDLQSNTEGR